MPKMVDAESLARKGLKRLVGLHLRDAKVILFGSRATGQARPHSDFDLAVEPRTGFKESQLSAFREAVEESAAIIYRVDVVNLSELGAAWRRQIEKEGVLWKS
jgi:predicted nucleotidyltransferase